MFEVLEQYLKKSIAGITDEQVGWIASRAVAMTVPKRHLLLQEGMTCHQKIYVVKGLLRNYSVGENGAEYLMKFTDAGGWTTDPESYNFQAPSKFYIDAIENSELLLWSRKDFEILKQQVPALAAFSEAIMTQNISLTQNRVLLNISASPEAKYLDFIRNFPNIFNRVPLHMVASYLGISRETLTRVRQSLATQAALN